MYSKKDVKGLKLDSNLNLQKQIQRENARKVLTPNISTKNIDINKKIESEYEKLIESSKKRKRKGKRKKTIRID